MLVKQRHLSKIVGRRAGCDGGSSALSPAGLPPATGGSMVSAVGSVEAGHPLFARMSLGDSTPASRARCQLGQHASGSARNRSPGQSRPTAGTGSNAIFLIVMAFRTLSVIGIAWTPLPLVPPSWLGRATGCFRARCPARLTRAGPPSAHAGHASTRQEFYLKIFSKYFCSLPSSYAAASVGGSGAPVLGALVAPVALIGRSGAREHSPEEVTFLGCLGQFEPLA
jgi:hypothetical protein